MTERRPNLFGELRDIFKPPQVATLETQASRFMSGLTFGATHETLLDAREHGIHIYHPGPEKKVVLGYPEAREVMTGYENVFIEYHRDNGEAFHLVGRVFPDRQFTLLSLEKFRKKSYRRVRLSKYPDVVSQVSGILAEIQLLH